MIRAKRKNRILPWLGAILAGLGLLFLYGPALIHRVYRLGTSTAEQQAWRKEYEKLALSEIYGQLDARQKSDSIYSRSRIYIWFHARGWNIDEGDSGEPAWLVKWRDLFSYWSMDPPL